MHIIRRNNVDDSHLNSLVEDPILRQILARRGVKSNDDLEVSLKNIFPPDRLLDIGKASLIIAKAIIDKKRVLIAGDYDIDGMTGTALGVRCLKAFGLDEHLIAYYVPSRYADGYGLNKRTVERALEAKVDLIITVDNGITAFEAVDFAKSHGMQVVVTDHHEVQDKIPDADAVVDPKRKGDTFPSKNLCGAAVLFYVMSATRSRLIELGYYHCIKDSPSMGQFLDLVTIGTIGDVMSFDTNNRRMIKAGLKRISKGKTIPGIQALLSYLKVDPAKIRIKNISHELCPRFNAATRINIAQNPAILNLTNDDFNLAMLFARQLDLCNKRRMDHEKIMNSRALAIYKEERLTFEQQVAAASALTAAGTRVDLQTLEYASQEANKVNSNASLVLCDDEEIAEAYNTFDHAMENGDYQDYGIALYDESFLKGLSGLVANRMRERYKKPCIIFSPDKAKVDDSNINLMGVIDNNGSLTPPQLIDPNLEPSATGSVPSVSAARAQGFGAGAFEGQMAVVNTAKIVSAASGPSMVKADSHDLSPECSYQDEGDMPLIGSARSVKGIDLMKVFDYIKSQEPDIFLACGGHAIAAGASIKKRDFARFKELFSAGCAQCKCTDEQEDAVISECELPDAYLCLDFARDLEYFGPWGKDFEEPIFDGEFMVDTVTILKNRHLKLMLRSKDNIMVEAIKFRANIKERASITPNIKVKVIYTLGIDRYFERERLQLNIEAIEPIA